MTYYSHSLNNDKKKEAETMKKIKKLGLVLLVLLIGATLASAGLIPFFGQIQTTASVQQSITIDGQPYNQPLEHVIPETSGGCCYTYEHMISNHACEGIWLDWDHHHATGIEISVYETESCCDHMLETLVINALDGQAQWDDFNVTVDSVPVYTYDAQGGNPEDWLTHTIDLTPFQLVCCGKHVVYIECTAESAWTNHDTYGQLAIDTIELYCEDQVLCDMVDIGDPTSESGHALCGWGPIEPATSGGAYGGINDCRVTWELGTKNDDLSRGASVVLECEECYEPAECECDHPSMMTPFYLDSGESIEICYTIYFDPLISPGEYTIRSKLIPGVAP